MLCFLLARLWILTRSVFLCFRGAMPRTPSSATMCAVFFVARVDLEKNVQILGDHMGGGGTVYRGINSENGEFVALRQYDATANAEAVRGLLFRLCFFAGTLIFLGFETNRSPRWRRKSPSFAS